MADKVRTRDYRFFRDNAGYCVGHRAEGALALARAETEARDRGIRFEWVSDADGDLGDHAYWCADEQRGIAHTHEIEACIAWDGDQVVGSLGSIIDADAHYQRVVEAEIAADALATV